MRVVDCISHVITILLCLLYQFNHEPELLENHSVMQSNNLHSLLCLRENFVKITKVNKINVHHLVFVIAIAVSGHAQLIHSSLWNSVVLCLYHLIRH
uniref:AlNc14C9G1213 protein n=1 Tax=Albugo laibachii Nc14 TaxID=890382 RepID=F0W2G2_9STRA|nr:AlNc14C9G1213 [Albugo laibachii Nc14]|eukprot:CCA15248.1 AlNc14C9G1213 [Albugo laibachii Nc14]